PLEQVRNLRRPALFLQGAYDYQVTVADDFENWRKALADSEDLEKSFSFKIYDDLDHLFMPCQKKSTPADYFLSARNVSGLVVDDIANWILSQGAP
ncbi:MAG: hypothetical protein K8F91_11255, partial [Candidatus Obscuribacterales bacterium]|nr:hypothetical protein [Candidatus Obscuribacterales bacterium]